MKYSKQDDQDVGKPAIGEQSVSDMSSQHTHTRSASDVVMGGLPDNPPRGKTGHKTKSATRVPRGPNRYSLVSEKVLHLTYMHVLEVRLPSTEDSTPALIYYYQSFFG